MSLMATAHVLAAEAQDSANAFKQGANAQSSHALMVQGYCLQVTAQQDLTPSGNARLASLEQQVMKSMGEGRATSRAFLDGTLPKMVRTCSDLDDYFNLSGSVADALLDTSLTKGEVESLIAEVQANVEGHREASAALVTELAGVRAALSSQASTFGTYSHELNNSIKGDKGVLQQLHQDVKDIDSKIDGCIAGVVLGGLAVAGGVFLIVVGAVAGFVTAGTSTALVVVGVGVIAAGAGATTASGIVLGNLVAEKKRMLEQQSSLEAEVKLLTGLGSQFSGLAGAAEGAAAAAQGMANAWSQTHDHLGNLRTRLQKAGAAEQDLVRQVFIKSAVKDINTVQGDVRIIQGQLSGVQTRKADDLAKSLATPPQTLLLAG